MENMMEMEETLRKVCEQRDRAWKVIGNLVDRFWAAHYNHAFDAEDRKTEEKDGKTVEYKCSAGKTLHSVFRGCNLFGKEGVCKGHDCPMGFHHRRFYEAVGEAEKILDEIRAEQIPFDFSRIPRYDPKKKYTVSAPWFARMCFMFLNGFMVGNEYTEEESRRIGDALASLVCIGFVSLGFVFPLDFLALRVEDEIKEDDPRIKPFKDAMVEFKAKYGEKIEEFEDSEIEQQEKLLKEDKEFALAMIVNNMVIVMCEYVFGHEYPGADMAVYQDAFDAMKFYCGVIMGGERDNFSIIKNINNTWLDEIGFKAEDRQ